MAAVEPFTSVERDRAGAAYVMALRRLSATDRIAIAALLALTLISVLGPFLAPHHPAVPAADPLSSPSLKSLMGTDEVGRDVFSRVLYGMRTSWLAALVVISSGVVIGGTIGLVAGASGGIVDTILMRATDAFLALPAPVLAIAVVAALGPSFVHTLVALGVVWWPFYARIVRGEVRGLAARPNIDAARIGGVGRVRLWRRHLLPGAVPAILITASLDVGGLLLTLAGLSFLGLGAPQPAPELGAMTAQGLPYLLSDWWVPIFPAIAIFFLAFVANLAGDSLRSLLEDR